MKYRDNEMKVSQCFNGSPGESPLANVLERPFR